MPERLDFIKQLVGKGGPDEEDDPRFENWLTQVASERRCGKLSSDEWQATRAAFGEALSPQTIQGFGLAKP